MTPDADGRTMVDIAPTALSEAGHSGLAFLVMSSKGVP